MDLTAGPASCRVVVGGPLAEALLDAARARFEIDHAAGTAHSTLTLHDADQAALRALLTMLWDSGHDVLALSTEAETAGGADR
jgi:hypothetical protein